MRRNMKIGTGFHFPATLTQEQLFTCRQPDRDTAHERNSYSPPPQVCTCTCMRAHTTALWINSSSTLLLAITAEGHTSAAGLSSRKKKPGSYVTSAQSWQAPRNRAARKQGKLGHSLSDCLSPSQPNTFINRRIYRARTQSQCPLLEQEILGRYWGDTQPPFPKKEKKRKKEYDRI